MGKLSEYRKLVPIICEHCGEEKFLRPYLAKTQRFCSIKCKSASKWIVHTCQICGNDFKRRKGHPGVLKYCSRKCTGEARIGLKLPKGKDNKNYIQNAEIRKCLTCSADMRITPGRSKTQKYCSRECQHGAENIGLLKAYCVDCGKELSKVKYTRCRSCANSGKNSSSWKDGATDKFQNKVRKGIVGKRWRQNVVSRDYYECQKCGSQTNIEAHHRMAFIDIIKKYNITGIDEALECDALWDLKNGITLCEECHKEFHFLYGKVGYSEADWEKWFNNIKIAI